MAASARLVLGSVLVVASCSGLHAAAPDNYPNRPIRLLIPFAPGGPSDIIARVFATKLGEALGQQVVMDNRGGAAGTIATELGARGAPDGYTIVQATAGTLAINPALFEKLAYQPARDFRPVSQLTATPYLLVVHPGVAARSVKDLIALARAKPGQVNFASGGIGTTNHLAAELFKHSAGVEIVHVPYKGTGQALTDLMGGQVQLMFMNLLPAMPQVRSGKLRALGVTSAKRSEAAPDVPTIAEAGVPGYETSGWHGWIVPARTPAPIVQRLHKEVARIAQQPDVRQRFSAEGTEVVGNTPDEFAAVIKVETVRWAKVVKSAGIKPE
jgi:tripartite-type tricarboxylate transporter receptor subunit TctC